MIAAASPATPGLSATSRPSGPSAGQATPAGSTGGTASGQLPDSGTGRLVDVRDHAADDGQMVAAGIEGMKRFVSHKYGNGPAAQVSPASAAQNFETPTASPPTGLTADPLSGPSRPPITPDSTSIAAITA